MSSGPSPSTNLVNQFLYFATTGQVERRDDIGGADGGDEFFSVLTVAAGTTTVGVGFGVLIARNGSLTTLATLIGLGLAMVGLAVLLPALGNVIRHPLPFGINPTPGPVVAGHLIREGHWVLHGQGWVRVEQVGFSKDGYTALLSTGEVVTLDEPRIVAGGEFAFGVHQAARRR